MLGSVILGDGTGRGTYESIPILLFSICPLSTDQQTDADLQQLLLHNLDKEIIKTSAEKHQ